jgi:hypothetical protein
MPWWGRFAVQFAGFMLCAMSRTFLIGEDDDGAAKRRAAYRRERDVIAHATTAHLVGLLGVDDELKRTAARDELLRRGEHSST